MNALPTSSARNASFGRASHSSASTTDATERNGSPPRGVVVAPRKSPRTLARCEVHRVSQGPAGAR
jgi:hypothetical protein